MIEQTIISRLNSLREELLAEGILLEETQWHEYYQTFRDRFGPDTLAGLDGEDLLLTIHGGINDDGMNYWLEFKNDEEFQTIKFGGIAGGSSLKFGIYRRKEDGAWITGHPGKQIVISLDQALAEARKQRDQFVRGSEILESFKGASDSDYAALEEKLHEKAPDVADTAWGHKYFHLLFPDKLDDFHSIEYQRFHLIKILQIPPEGRGRYVSAGRFIMLGRKLEMPVAQLTGCLKQLNGSLHRYWRVGTTQGDTGEDMWPPMRDGGHVGIGWTELGDLSGYSYAKTSLEAIKSEMAKTYPQYSAQLVGRKCREVFSFVTVAAEGDLVLACRGRRVIGVGKKIRGTHKG